MAVEIDNRWYIDATMTVSWGETTKVWGPFEDRNLAEQTMAALAGRPDVLQARLRDPGA